MRILLIDDDPFVTENLALYLRKQHHTVLALNLIHSQDYLESRLRRFLPEGVILDLEMYPPGETVYRWIRSWSDTVSVVFYTKYGRSLDHRQRIGELGVGEHQIVLKKETASDVQEILRALQGLRGHG